MSNQLAPANNQQMHVFANAQAFETSQRIAKALSSSDLVPKEYKNNLSNCLVALEVAGRIGASPLMVMQNLYVIHGRPSWSSQFVIAALNSSGRFKALRFEMDRDNGKKVSYSAGGKSVTVNDITCIAWTEDDAGERLESPKVSIQMALDEGWLTKNGSKWQTMPELMLRYRAAAFFGRLYAPEVLMGMQTEEEVRDVQSGAMLDVTPVEEKTESILSNINEQIKSAKGEVVTPPAPEAQTIDENKAAAASPEPEPIAVIESFDINQYNLSTQKGTKEALIGICEFLKDIPQDERASLFLGHGGLNIVSVLGKHGLGMLRKRITDLGISLPDESEES